MTNFFEVFQPGLKYAREQEDRERVLIVEVPRGVDGLDPIDLESGHIQIPVPVTDPVTDADEPSTKPVRAKRATKSKPKDTDR